MSVIPYPGFLYVDNICALSGADVTELNTGCLAFVESEDAYYRLALMNPPPVPNGTDVISVPGGPPTPGCLPSVFDGDNRRWILTNIADAVGETANSLAWYINAATGSDSATGTDPAHPVKTFREVGERWKRGAGYNIGHLDPSLNGPVHVHIQSSYLLDTDTILVERPVANDYPIIVTYDYDPSGNAPVVITSATDIDHAGNILVSLSGPALGTHVGKYVLLTAGPLAGYWAYIYSLSNGDPSTVLTTPFVKQVPNSPDLILASTVAADIAAASPVLRVAGCSVPSTVLLSIDPGSEVWLYDVSMHDLTPPTIPAPFAEPGLFSGVLRFFRSEGDPSGTNLVAGTLASISFSGSSTANMSLVTLGNAPGATCSASFVELAGSSLRNLVVDKDSVFSPNAKLDVGRGQDLTVGDAAANELTSLPAIEVVEGSVHFTGAFYGQDNTVPVLNMKRYARGSYDPAIVAKLTVAEGGANIPYSAQINFQNGVVKTFVSGPPGPLVNIPFVSNATASDSQAGLIAST